MAQNLTVVFCAIMLLLTLMFRHSLSPGLYILLEVLVIVPAAFAQLPSMATKVAVVKDWVVVICESDKSRLAGKLTSSAVMLLSHFHYIATTGKRCH